MRLILKVQSEWIVERMKGLFGRAMITDVKLHIFRQIATNYTKKFIKNLCPILILFSGDVDC